MRLIDRSCLLAALLVAGLVAVTTADAQPSPGRPSQPAAPARQPAPALPNRIFVDVNGGFQSTTERFSDERSDPFFGETATWTADYETGGAPLFDVGGGVRVWRQLVASVAYSRFKETSIAGIEGAAPHPFFFDRARAFAGDAVDLTQQEDVVHAGAMWAVPVTRSLDLRVFGGPSFYFARRDLVAEVEYDEAYPYDTATFGRARVERVTANALGFNVGADVTWMFTRSGGVGAMARFSRAETDLQSPASQRDLAFRFGGLQFGAGLRFRFGRPGPSREAPGTRGTRPGRRTAQPRQPSTDAPDAPAPAPDARNDDAGIAAGATVVLTRDTRVFVRPGALQPLRVLKAGTRLRVREDAGEWLMVEFRDPSWGARVGYVKREDTERR